MVASPRSLITGANGFIGKALCPELQAQGHNITTVSHQLLWDKEELERLVRRISPDYIFHLSSYGNMAHHSDHNEIFRANVINTFNLLEASKHLDYKKFVYVSSSSVTLPKQTLYSACKSASESLLTAYDKSTVVIRPYSVTGVGEQRKHLIPTLIDAAFSGKEVMFVPQPVHDFIDVCDVVDGIIKSAQRDIEGIVALGSGHSYSNQDVLDTVEFVTKKKIKTKAVESLRSYDSTAWQAPYDNSTKTLTQSIKEMVEVYEKR